MCARQASLRVESAVLADPALINPNTGQPFGGFLEEWLPGEHFFDRMLDPLQSEIRIGPGPLALLHRRYRQQAEADGCLWPDCRPGHSFFAGEIVLRLGIQGSARLMDGELTFMRFHVRFLSD